MPNYYISYYYPMVYLDNNKELFNTELLKLGTAQITKFYVNFNCYYQCQFFRNIYYISIFSKTNTFFVLQDHQG